MWNSFLSLWFRLLGKSMMPEEKSSSDPLYLAETMRQKSSEVEMKSGLEKTSIDSEAHLSQPIVSPVFKTPPRLKSTNRKLGRPKGSKNKKSKRR